MRRIDEVVKKIADKVSEALFEAQGDYDVEMDEGEIESASVYADFNFGTCEVECDYYYGRGKDETYVEVMLYPAGENHSLERLELAVNEKVNEQFDFDKMFNGIEKSVQDSNEDEWQLHGFRDEADYLRYRYG